MKHRFTIGALLALLLLLLIASPVMADTGATNAILIRDFTLEQGEELLQDLATFGGRVHLQRDTLVDGDVAILGGEALFEGRIKGDVVIMGGTLELGATSIVDGDVVVFGQLRRHAGSQVRGSLVEGAQAKTFEQLPRLFNARPGIGLPQSARAMNRLEPVAWMGRLARGVGTIIVLLFVAALVTVVMPDNLARIAQVMRHSAPICVVVGLLTVVLTPLLIVLLSIICVGLPLAIVLALAFVVAGLIGWVAAGQIVGQFIFQVLKLERQSALVETLLGVLLLALVSTFGALGTLLFLLVSTWGLGSVLLTRLGRMPYPATASFAPQPAIPAPPAPPTQPGPVAQSGSQSTGYEPRKGDTKPLEPPEWMLDDEQDSSD